MLHSLLKQSETDDSFEEGASPWLHTIRKHESDQNNNWKKYLLYVLVGVVVLFPYVGVISLFAIWGSQKSCSETNYEVSYSLRNN